ncbi:hypothetical protein ACLOJK_028615 [Asimina triloba]
MEPLSTDEVGHCCWILPSTEIGMSPLLDLLFRHGPLTIFYSRIWGLKLLVLMLAGLWIWESAVDRDAAVVEDERMQPIGRPICCRRLSATWKMKLPEIWTRRYDLVTTLSSGHDTAIWS